MLSTFNKCAIQLGEIACLTSVSIEPLVSALATKKTGPGLAQAQDQVQEQAQDVRFECPPQSHMVHRLAPRRAFPSNTPNGVKEPVQEAPRFDDLYYKKEDKLNRDDYQQTWVEYPPRIEKRKEFCLPD